ncbi:hypothetical protein CROQUDRAFT_129923 [Cronartium quercuum f. sp. fusiforme G11]|uniref:Uncharacterized protein n=1 Tax=Cronartium quercuum f. sp. fusiforme G11 TaxID=708437 RepID=A0A9P6NQG3_9BASI|nr:hypothetical protein CROQUDRAFT_129923 [Cronartium quercuum f. sp. fusiforme G11]
MSSDSSFDDCSKLLNDYSDLIKTSFNPPTFDSVLIDFNNTSSSLTRTKSIDSLSLHNSTITSKYPFPRSKSSTAIHPTSTSQKPTKSILRRPNSPSKGSRARFFSPKDISIKPHDRNQSHSLDHNGNLRARELVHEYEVDAPPSTCYLSSRPTINTPRHEPASSPSIRRSAHLPRFTIPEPEELDIEPILPCNMTSTSPTLSPPPPPIRSDSGSHSMISSTSLNFNQDTLSNIMDETAGFLGDDTTWVGSGAQTTEQSIDLNHVAMMQVLASRSSKLGNITKASTKHSRPTIYQRPSLVQFESVEEVDEASTSVDVEKLVSEMKGTHETSMDHALKDETAPEYLQLDLSTTLERSLVSTTPTLPPSSPVRALDHFHLSSPPKTTTPTKDPVDENLEWVTEKPTQILSLPSKRHSLALVQPLRSLTNQQPTPVLKSESMVRKRASLLPPSKSKMNIESGPSQLCTRTSLLPPSGTSLRKRASLVPPSKTSGLGLGLPGRTKPKPSTATVPVSGRSPRVLKGRSSISSAMVSPRRVINGRVKVDGGRLMRPSNSSNEIRKPGGEIGRIRPSVSSNEISSWKDETFCVV